MTSLHDRLHAAQNACVLVFLLGYLVLTLVVPRYAAGVPLIAGIAAYCLAASAAWWWIASPGTTHRPDERVRTRWWEASTVALYAFFVGVLAITAYRAANGIIDAPIFYLIDVCVVIWIVDGLRRTAR
jgi:hypothetical protein